MTTDFNHSFVYPDGYASLNERFLSEELYEQFKKKILFRINAQPNNPYGITPPNGLLVYGPPCNGKSILVRQFAQMTALPYVIVNRHDLLERDGSHTCGGFKALMTVAKQQTPCVIIIENVETIFPDRKKITNNVEYVDIMSNLSLMKNCGNKGIYVFATTSKPMDVDSQLGMSGYLNELFYASYLDKEQRRVLIKSLMGGRPCQEDIDYDLIAEDIVDFTIGDIVSLIDEIALNSAIANTVISNHLAQTTLESFRQPLASQGRKGYEEIHTLLESKKRRHNTRVIGFR